MTVQNNYSSQKGEDIFTYLMKKNPKLIENIEYIDIESLKPKVYLSNCEIKELINDKLKFIDSLKKEALQMKRPESVGNSRYRFLGNIFKKITFDIAIDRQDYTCFICGYRPKNVDKFLPYEKEKGRELKPHRIVHKRFLGDYEISNVVILCERCHNVEYDYFEICKRRFYKNGKLMEWEKLIEESFEFFKEVLMSYEKVRRCK